MDLDACRTGEKDPRDMLEGCGPDDCLWEGQVGLVPQTPGASGEQGLSGHRWGLHFLQKGHAGGLRGISWDLWNMPTKQGVVANTQAQQFPNWLLGHHLAYFWAPRPTMTLKTAACGGTFPSM